MHAVGQIILTVTLSALMTGAGFVLLYSTRTVSRAEVTQQIENESPWAREAGTVKTKIRSNERQIEKLESALSTLTATQHRLTVDVRVLVEKVNQLLETQRG